MGKNAFLSYLFEIIRGVVTIDIIESSKQVWKYVFRSLEMNKLLKLRIHQPHLTDLNVSPPMSPFPHFYLDTNKCNSGFESLMRITA